MASTGAAVFRKGAWSNDEDEKLRKAVDKYGLRNWVAIEKYSGLGRPAKNCRLRWLNYLRPNLKKYPFTQEEEELVFRLHSKYGNSWSRIASELPGRSDNEIKNFWHKRSNKRRRHCPTSDSHKACNSSKNEDHLPSTSTHSPNTDNISIVTEQSTILPNTPTSSRTQNFLISPNTRTQSSTENLSFSTHDTLFSFRKPPILASLSKNSSFLPQMQFPSVMESPRSPLKLNLSADAQVTSFSAFQLQSPNSAPLSPLKLRLSIPMPSESCFRSNPLIPDPTAQLSSQKEPPSIQAQPDSKFAIMKELKEARARVKFLKRKLKLRRTLNKTSLQKKSSETTDLTGSSSDSTTKECTSRTSLGTKNLIAGILRAEKSPIRTTGEENSLQKGDNSVTQKYTHGRSIEQRKNYSLSEIFNRENSLSFRNMIHFSDHRNIKDTINATNNQTCYFQGPTGESLIECSAMDGLYSEGSNPLQDGDNNNSYNMFSERSHEPLRNVFGPVYSQRTSTTPSDDIGQLRYYQTEQGCYFDYGFGQEILDGLDVNLSQTQDMLGSSCLISAPIMEQEYFRVEDFSFHQTENPEETNMLSHKSSSSPNLIENLVDSRYLEGFGQDYLAQGKQYLTQSCGHDELDFNGGNPKSDCVPGERWRQETCKEQSLMEGLMVDIDNTLWPERVEMMESKAWSDGSGCGNTWDVLEQKVEHEHDNVMSEELSSLLEFCPTNNQTVDWYNIGNAIPDNKATNDLGMLSTSQTLLTTADYL